MAKSLATILSQIEKLQREAESIQMEVVERIRKEIAKYGLTPEQLFGGGAPKKRGAKPVAKSAAAPKYADGAGNTWGGMGKRPTWLKEALEAGAKLEDFLVANAPATRAKPVRAAKAPAKKAAAARKTASGKPAAKKRRTKPAKAATPAS
ncbi:MAG: hypothetical protein DI603_23400 [Roseateles depolymerans]|uniref:DNA-binding protein H-NS-like C-terminal domain-containing protein n=1 Tax=Roseateles depolymerans TaxID=76731 RepID=A0A2W5D462_9BURK|nr:MAG: hypothetical protein DI603_23400 [Roseateles depolymerans]